MPPRWSPDEDGVLRRLYTNGIPLRVIAERVGRSEDAVAERRRTLGMPARPRQRRWSPHDDALLRGAAALGLPATAVAERLRRPAEQVRRRRRTLLGTSRAQRPFTATEDAQIAAGWARNADVEAVARALGRPVGSVRLRAQRLGVHRPHPRPRWRPVEDAAVRDGYESGLTCDQIATELTGRTASAVAARAAKLGLATYARRWTPREDDLLQLHGALNPASLAELLDRSPEAITQRLRRLGLRQGAKRSPHHPVPTRGGLTPGQRLTVARELRAGGAARQLAVARRLGLRPAELRIPNRRASA